MGWDTGYGIGSDTIGYWVLRSNNVGEGMRLTNAVELLVVEWLHWFDLTHYFNISLGCSVNDAPATQIIQIVLKLLRATDKFYHFVRSTSYYSTVISTPRRTS